MWHERDVRVNKSGCTILLVSLNIILSCAISEQQSEPLIKFNELLIMPCL